MSDIGAKTEHLTHLRRQQKYNLTPFSRSGIVRLQCQNKDFALRTILLETVELYARTIDFTDGPTAGRRFWISPFRSLFSRLAVLIAREPCVWPETSKDTMNKNDDAI